MLITLPDRVLTSSIIGLRNLFLFLPDTEAILDFCNLQKFWKLGTSQKVIISSAFRVFQPHGSVMDTPGGTDAGVHTQTGSQRSKLGVLRPVQQPGSYWDRSSELPLVGLEPTEVTAYD